MDSVLEEKRVEEADSEASLSTTGCRSNCDCLDPDLSEHISCFVRSVCKTLSLSRVSIATAEDAKEALILLTDLRDQVRAHRKTAEALKTLVLSDAPARKSKRLQASGLLQ